MFQDGAGVLFTGWNWTKAVIRRLRLERLSRLLILFVDEARVIVIHVSVRVEHARNRRINSRLHLKRPPVRIVGFVAKLKPSGCAVVARRQSHHLRCSLIEVIVDPVRMAVEILHHV